MQQLRLSHSRQTNESSVHTAVAVVCWAESAGVTVSMLLTLVQRTLPDFVFGAAGASGPSLRCRTQALRWPVPAPPLTLTFTYRSSSSVLDQYHIEFFLTLP